MTHLRFKDLSSIYVYQYTNLYINIQILKEYVVESIFVDQSCAVLENEAKELTSKCQFKMKKYLTIRNFKTNLISKKVYNIYDFIYILIQICCWARRRRCTGIRCRCLLKWNNG